MIYRKAAKELEKLGKTADAALAAGLAVNAGHDLTVGNLPALARRIPGLAEVSIGHGLTADALEYGMASNDPAVPQGVRMVIEQDDRCELHMRRNEATAMQHLLRAGGTCRAPRALSE